MVVVVVVGEGCVSEIKRKQEGQWFQDGTKTKPKGADEHTKRTDQ